MVFLKHIWNKLHLRLTLLVILLSVLPLIILGVFALSSSQRTLENQQFDHLNAVALLKADEINRWMENETRQLKALAQRPLVSGFANMLTTEGLDAAVARSARQNLLDDHLLPTLTDEGGFWELFLLHADSGQVLASTEESSVGKYRSNEPYFIAGKKDAYVQNVYYFLPLGQPMITIGTPVRNDQGEVVAVLAGHLDLAMLSAIAEQTNDLTSTEDTYLVNNFNFFVTDPRFGENYALQETIQSEGVVRCLQQESGHGFYKDYRGTAVLGAYEWLPQRELCVLTEIDRAEALSATNSLRRSLFVVGILVALGVVTSGLFFARSITNPLQRLMKGVEWIGRGDLDHQIPVRGEDEIGRLTAAFNQMTQDLRHSIGQNVYDQKLLLTLSRTAQAVQQARTPREVYEMMGAEMAKLDFDVTVLLLTDDKEHLRVGYLSHSATTVAAAEKLTGLSAKTFRFPLPAGGYYEQIVRGGETMFIKPMSDFVAEALPKRIHFLANRVATMLGMEQGIIAPLIVEDDVLGVLTVTGANLTEADVTAVSTFASQTAIALQNTRYITELRRNEARFRAIFEHAGMGIARVDLAGKPIESNAALQGMLGYRAEELQQMPFSEFTRPEGVGTDLSLYQSLIAGERDVYDIEKRYMHKDGGEVWARLTVSLVRNAEGEPEFAIAMVHDITQRKQYQAAHERQRAFLESIYHGADLAIFVVNVSEEGEFRYEGLNPAHERLSGLKSDEVRGKTPHDLVPYIPPEAAAAIHANYARCLPAGQVISYEEMIPMGGKTTWWLTRLSPLRNADGRIFRIVGTSMSISERKRAEQKLRRSEALRRVALEGAQLGTWTNDLLTHETFWDARAREIFGVREDEPITLELGVNIIHPDDRECAKAEFARATDPVTGHGHYGLEKRIVLPDGSIRWVATKGRVLFEENEEDGRHAVRLTGIVMDITARKEAEEALRRHRDELEVLVAERAAALKASEARYRTLTESSPDIIFLIDQDNVVTYVNRVAANQFGKRAADVIGRPHTDLFPAKMAAQQQQALQHVLNSGEMVQAESKVTFPQHKMWLHTRLVPITESGDRITAVLGISRDITSLKEAELALEKKAADLERSNKELEQFAYVASHDLQEPLRMVSNYLQLLQRRYRGQLDESADEFIGFAVDGASRMKILINDLLAYSRVGTRGKPFAPVSAERLLQKALDNLQISIEDSEACITHDPLPTIMADANQMVQLFQNLIGNAIKFRGEARPQIHVGVTQQEDVWQFSIHDNGIGIDPKFTERIFVIFQRLHTRTEYDGTGIGLAICKKIIERHHGQIRVDSQPGVGTTFFFTIPKNHEKEDD